jgi:hypothetical protein
MSKVPGERYVYKFLPEAMTSPNPLAGFSHPGFPDPSGLNPSKLKQLQLTLKGLTHQEGKPPGTQTFSEPGRGYFLFQYLRGKRKSASHHL